MKYSSLYMTLALGLFIGALYVGLSRAFPGDEEYELYFGPAEYLRLVVSLGALAYAWKQEGILAVGFAAVPAGQLATEWALTRRSS